MPYQLTLWFIPFYAFQASMLVLDCKYFAGTHILFSIVCSCPIYDYAPKIFHFVCFALCWIVSQKYGSAARTLEFAYFLKKSRSSLDLAHIVPQPSVKILHQDQQPRASFKDNPDCSQLLSEVHCLNSWAWNASATWPLLPALVVITSLRKYRTTTPQPAWLFCGV